MLQPWLCICTSEFVCTATLAATSQSRPAAIQKEMASTTVRRRPSENRRVLPPFSDCRLPMQL